LQGEESKKEELARMLCRHVQLQFQSLDWRNIAKHQTRHGKQKKPRSNTKKTLSTNNAKEQEKQQEKNTKKTRKKHENGTRKKHEKNTKQLKSTILASG
jgi:hypothetical protein